MKLKIKKEKLKMKTKTQDGVLECRSDEGEMNSSSAELKNIKHRMGEL